MSIRWFEAGIDLAFEDLGEQQVKNITQPVRVWQWTNDARAAAPPTTEAAAASLREKPSIAVLPFDNGSHDPDQEYFSDGLTEDLITDLSQLSGLFVTARHAVFQYKGRTATPQQVARGLGVRYVLEGSVRRAANRVRSRQLIDATTGFHVWAQRYDRDFEDIFTLQDEITHTIVAALDVRLTAREQVGIERRYTENLEAYDLFLQAREGFWRRTREGAAQARTTLERAIVLDPKFAAAHALLAEIWRSEWLFGWRDDEDALDRALELARKAVALDDGLPFAHMFLGWIHFGARSTIRQLPKRNVAWRSTRTTPRVMSAWAYLGPGGSAGGRPSVHRNGDAPRSALSVPVRLLAGTRLRFAGALRRGHCCLPTDHQPHPGFFYARPHLAAVYAHLGRMEEAKSKRRKHADEIKAFPFCVSRNVCRSRTPPRLRAWSRACERRACRSEGTVH